MITPKIPRTRQTLDDVLRKPLPATAKPTHVADNVRAGYGRLPDERQRAKMRAVLEAA